MLTFTFVKGTPKEYDPPGFKRGKSQLKIAQPSRHLNFEQIVTTVYGFIYLLAY